MKLVTQVPSISGGHWILVGLTDLDQDAFSNMGPPSTILAWTHTKLLIKIPPTITSVAFKIDNTLSKFCDTLNSKLAYSFTIFYLYNKKNYIQFEEVSVAKVVHF